MSLIGIFPTLDALDAAPLHDVAAVILQAARNQARPTFNARNLISSLADAYTNDVSTNTPPHVRRDRARHIVAEAMGYLFSENFLSEAGEDGVGILHQVTRLGKSIKTREDFTSYAKAALLPRDLLRGELATIALPLFLSGHYDEAVLVAFKQIEVGVRKIGKYSNEDFGVSLMRKAFGPSGSLTDQTNSVESEREALAHLFAGAIGYFKNPLSHRNLDIDDARMAASRILFANELLALLDIRRSTLDFEEPDAP